MKPLLNSWCLLLSVIFILTYKTHLRIPFLCYIASGFFLAIRIHLVTFNTLLPHAGNSDSVTPSETWLPNASTAFSTHIHTQLKPTQVIVTLKNKKDTYNHNFPHRRNFFALKKTQQQHNMLCRTNNMRWHRRLLPWPLGPSRSTCHLKVDSPIFSILDTTHTQTHCLKQASRLGRELVYSTLTTPGLVILCLFEVHWLLILHTHTHYLHCRVCVNSPCRSRSLH